MKVGSFWAVAIFGNLPPQLLEPFFHSLLFRILCEDRHLVLPIDNAVGDAKFLIMGEADGDSGRNKIEVPVYWFPKDLWACSVPGGSNVIADGIFAHKPHSSQPISLSGTLLSAPSPCVWGGDGSSLVVQGCVTVSRSLLALITDTAAPKALGSRRLPLLLPFTPTAPRSFGPAFPWEVFV